MIRVCAVIMILVTGIAMVRAAEIGGASFDEEIHFSDRPVKLRSLAIKEATFFRINIYAVAFYTEREVRFPEGLLSADQLKVFVLRFFVDIDRGKLAESWLQNLSGSCLAECDSLMTRAGRLTQRLPDISKGHTVTYAVSPDRTDITVDGALIGSLEGTDASRSVLAAFLGPKAPKKLRQDLLRSLQAGAGRD